MKIVDQLRETIRRSGPVAAIMSNKLAIELSDEILRGTVFPTNKVEPFDGVVDDNMGLALYFDMEMTGDTIILVNENDRERLVGGSIFFGYFDYLGEGFPK